MENTEKIDVCINVYGKPWQTLCTLKSLMKYSSKHIDKIYFIEEKQQPFNDDITWVKDYFDNIISYTPYKYEFLPRMSNYSLLNNEEYRYSFRYQYGIEKSNKNFLFITHNDVLYTGDIIGEMLENIGENVGVGLIGQCWNCPAHYADECDSERFNSYNTTYSHIIELSNTFKPARGSQFNVLINKERVMPLPECRLNEFSCLINRPVTVNECYPKGNSHFFGEYSGIDIASAWFQDLIYKGYKFLNYDIKKTSIHGYFTKTGDGLSTQMNEKLYIESEGEAKKYYNDILNR